MQKITVNELTTHFPKVIQSIQENGESFVIQMGKKQEEVAMLVPYQFKKRKNERIFGIYQGKGSFSLSDDFAMTEEELLGLWTAILSIPIFFYG